MSSNFVTCGDGTKLHYLREGNPDAPQVICLHGLGGSTNTFTPIIPRLSQPCNIVRVDFPGFGKSPPSGRRHTVADYVTHLYDVVASLQAADGEKEPSAKVIGDRKFYQIIVITS